MTAADVLAVAAEAPFFRRVRLRAERRVLWMRSRWARESAGGGIVIPDAEVDRILAGREGEVEQEESFRQLDGATSLTRAIEEADGLFEQDPRWGKLRQSLGLRQAECDLLSLALAVEVEPWFARVCGYLHDDATISGATIWLAGHLFGWTSAAAFGNDSALLRWRLAEPADSKPLWGATTIWKADPQLAARLCAVATDVWQGLDGVRVALPADAPDQSLHEPELRQCVRFVEDIRASQPRTPIEIQLLGAPGSGRRTLAMQLCAAIEKPLVLIELFAPATDADAAGERLLRAARAARLLGAGVCVHGGDDAPPHLWRLLRQRCDLLIVAGEVAPPRDDAARLSVRLRPLKREARQSLWTRLTGTTPPPPVAEWSLTAGEIVAAARVAPAGAEAVAANCARMLDRELPDLLTRMPLPYDWDDIIVAEHVRRALHDFENQVCFRHQVLDEWGFERLVPFGRGLTAMFAGPSGTGKTMAAQIIARSRALPLYRVDLAGVVDKYIGETEKRLKRVFDACERAEAILFFDEADALFGHRTQVRDAHDRFANIEIDYLLQRMEQFEGIAILATNRKADLDSAFLRRIRVVIDFIPPARDERLALWHLALEDREGRSKTLLEAIDWEYLADKLVLTAAEIKSAVLGAAFLARAEGTCIGMRHVVAGARREVTKRGAVLRTPEWEG